MVLVLLPFPMCVPVTLTPVTVAGHHHLRLSPRLEYSEEGIACVWRAWVKLSAGLLVCRAATVLRRTSISLALLSSGGEARGLLCLGDKSNGRI